LQKAQQLDITVWDEARFSETMREDAQAWMLNAYARLA
jgi:DNA ligase (NAD+)